MGVVRYLFGVLGCVFLVPLGGCGSTARDPITVNHAYSIQTKDFQSSAYIITTTAGRSSAYIYQKLNKAPEICVAPPPDAVDSLANALAASASGSADGATVQAQLSQALTITSQLDSYRSQGLQLAREKDFWLCEEIANGAITPEEALEKADSWFGPEADLIKEELPVILANAQKPMAGNGQGSLPAGKQQ